MKITIERDILLEALQLAVNISPKATSNPIIHNVLIETAGSACVSLKATNHENTVYGEFDANVIDAGSICVSTSKLFNLVREFHGKTVQIESTPQNWVYLVCGQSNIKLPGVEPDKFPTVEFKTLEREVYVSPIVLKHAIDRTYFAIGENESRKNLMGLNLQIVSPEMISWKGADSFRICQFNSTLDEPLNLEGNIIIPKKSLQEIKRVIEFGEERIKISFDDNIFQIFTNNIKYKTRLIEAEFPNLNRLIDAPSIHTVTLPKSELHYTVRILSTLTEGDQKSVMKLTFEEGKTTLESQKLEFGEGNDVIFCDYVGEKMSIGLNIRFFLDAIQSFDSASEDSIMLCFSNPESPFVLKCEEWENYKTVLMPVRIQW